MKNAYDIFINKVEKEFQKAVDEVAIEDCLADYVLYIVGDGFLFDGTRMAGSPQHHKPLTVRLSSEENQWLKKIDLEWEWENTINDYGDDEDCGEMVRNNGRQLVADLRRVARKLELQINELEESEDD